MKIRPARREDIPAVLDMGRAMLEESRFRIYPLNEAKAFATTEAMIGTPAACVLLAERSNGELAGMLAGYVTDYYFCDATIAQDRVFYVKPEYRGSPAAVKLLLAFRRWAENRRVNEISITMSVAIDMPRFNKLMTHLGFGCCGSNFSLKLAQPGDMHAHHSVACNKDNAIEEKQA